MTTHAKPSSVCSGYSLYITSINFLSIRQHFSFLVFIVEKVAILGKIPFDFLQMYKY